MSRLIKTGDTPAKKRYAHMRSCAEVLRLLAQRAVFDEEAHDMTAFFVFNLRSIYQTIDESAHAWDERNYWKKAEALREKWRWTRTAADQLETLIRTERWDGVPPVLLGGRNRSSCSVRLLTSSAWCWARRWLMVTLYAPGSWMFLPARRSM